LSGRHSVERFVLQRLGPPGALRHLVDHRRHTGETNSKNSTTRIMPNDNTRLMMKFMTPPRRG
jgi:hypothetical protein